MSTTPAPDDRFPLAAVYAVLFFLGAALGLWGAFLVPLRLPGGLEGLAVLLAFGGNFAVGAAAGRATRSLPAAAASGIGWLVTVVLVNSIIRPSDEVILPAALGSDPGIGTVSLLFVFGGAVGAVLAVVVANRYTRRPAPPTSLE